MTVCNLLSTNVLDSQNVTTSPARNVDKDPSKRKKKRLFRPCWTEIGQDNSVYGVTADLIFDSREQRVNVTFHDEDGLLYAVESTTEDQAPKPMLNRQEYLYRYELFLILEVPIPKESLLTKGNPYINYEINEQKP